MIPDGMYIDHLIGSHTCQRRTVGAELTGTVVENAQWLLSSTQPTLMGKSLYMVTSMPPCVRMLCAAELSDVEL